MAKKAEADSGDDRKDRRKKQTVPEDGTTERDPVDVFLVAREAIRQRRLREAHRKVEEERKRRRGSEDA